MALGMRLGGIDHQFWFDMETGIILRHVGLVNGDPCAIDEFKDLVINQPIPDEDFAFVPPPDATVERLIDRMIRNAEMRGVDLSDIDLTDKLAVQAAMSSSRSGGPLDQTMMESKRAKHIPTPGVHLRTRIRPGPRSSTSIRTTMRPTALAKIL